MGPLEPLKTPGGDHHGHEPSAREAESGDTLPVDLNRREIAILVPIAVMVVLLGVLPNIVLKSVEDPVRQLLSISEGEPQLSAPQNVAVAGAR